MSALDHGGDFEAETRCGQLDDLLLATRAITEGDMERAHMLVERHNDQVQALASGWDAPTLRAVQLAQRGLIEHLTQARQAVANAMRRREGGRSAVDCYARQNPGTGMGDE